MTMTWKAIALVLALVAAPVLTFAQAPGVPPTATSPPHPSMPWSGLPYSGGAGGTGYGNVIRYIQVAPQQVEIEVAAPAAEGKSEGTQKQVVEIPGYIVTETTTGFIYPERQSLQQVSPGVYQWVTLPQQFQPK